MANIEKYNAAFIEVFGVTEEVLNESFSKENTEEWDSVHQLNIISILEESFDIMFEPEEIMELISYGKGIEILGRYGIDLYPCYLRWRYGMDIGRNCRISWKAHLDKSINPKGIHIGDNTWVLSGAMILAHDHCRSLKADTYIGANCVIGVRSIIMLGLMIGNQVVIGGVAW